MTAASDMKPSEALRKARKLITQEEAWIRGLYAEDDRGNALYGNEPGAIKFCAVGAMQHINDSRVFSGQFPESVFLKDAMGSHIAEFNNSHTHAEVLNAFDRAIVLAEAEGR